MKNIVTTIRAKLDREILFEIILSPFIKKPKKQPRKVKLIKIKKKWDAQSKNALKDKSYKTAKEALKI